MASTIGIIFAIGIIVTLAILAIVGFADIAEKPQRAECAKAAALHHELTQKTIAEKDDEKYEKLSEALEKVRGYYYKNC